MEGFYNRLGLTAVPTKVESLWRNYEVIFPSNLRTTFKAPTTLLVAEYEALLMECSQNIYGCFSYDIGQTFAATNREIHDDHVTSFLPLLVSKERNMMCFRGDGVPPEQTYDTFPDSSFTVPHLSALTVEESINLIVDSANDDHDGEERSQSSFDYFSVFYSNSYFNNDLDKIQQNFLSRIIALQLYDVTSFDTFFWTSAVTADYFHSYDGNDFDVLQDMNRHAHWMDLRERVAALNSDGDGDDDVDNEKEDYCGFADLTASMQWFEEEGQIKIPISQRGERGEEQFRTCIAFLAATFASDASVFLTTLSNNPSLFNYRARSIMESCTKSSDAANAPYTTAGLQGEGQIASVSDTGVDLTSCYFFDSSGYVPYSSCYSPVYNTSMRKVIEYTYLDGYSDTIDEAGGHGTHVCGTVLGSIDGADITTTGKYDGIAPNAKLAFFDMGKDGVLYYPGVATTYNPGYKAGAHVQSNSWGSMYSGSQYYYGADVDFWLYQKTDTMIFFSAGNDGKNGASTITMDASSKNVIAVGSSESSGGDMSYIAWYSSQGPAYDNRIKPDLVAPGDSLMSALSNGVEGATCGTEYKTGTSMAAPASAGTALLVRQYFEDKNHQFWLATCSSAYTSCVSFSPSGVLVKAVLLHAGEPMALFDGSQGGGSDITLGAPPDFQQGYGRIALPNVLPLQGVYDFDLFVDDMVKAVENSVIEYTVSIPTASLGRSNGSDEIVTATTVADEEEGENLVEEEEEERFGGTTADEYDTAILYTDKLRLRRTRRPSKAPTPGSSDKPTVKPSSVTAPSRTPATVPTKAPVPFAPTKPPTSPPNTANVLKITISWYDPPNVQGATTAALVQNLDLRAVSPSGQVYWGNGGTSADQINNNEQIFVANPEAGDWVVSVTSAALPYAGYQKFSIVITSLGSVSYGA